MDQTGRVIWLQLMATTVAVFTLFPAAGSAANQPPRKALAPEERRSRTIDEALAQALSEQRERESAFESNPSAGRPRLKPAATKAQKVQVEVGDTLGGWSVRQDEDFGKDQPGQIDRLESSAR